MKNESTISRRNWLRLTGAATLGTVLSTRLAQAAGMDLFSGINRVADPAKKSGLEKKHAPMFEAPAKAAKGDTVQVTVKVGESAHPMTDKHWIETVRIFTDKGQPLASVDFGRTGVTPTVTVNLPITESTTLVAQAVCNLHGTWESRHTITV